MANNNSKNDNRTRAGHRGNAGKLNIDKMATRPPSLNGINKQLP
jgi:hypothetical protein